MSIERRDRQRARLILIYFLLLSPFVIKGTMSALQTTANSPLDWVDDNFAPRANYDRFVDDFGAGDVVVISWPGCSVNDPKVDHFARSLRQSPLFFSSDRWLFHSVISGREMLRGLLSPPSSLALHEAKRRVRSSLLGPDGETTAVVIGFTDLGLQRRSDLVPLIRAAAIRYGGAKREDLHLAGPIVDGYEVDRASQRTMSRFAPLSSLIVFCVCVLCIDSFYAAVLVFGTAAICQACALAILHYAGGNMTALMIVLPPLIQVLAIAGGIHLVNYYLDARAAMGPAGKPKSAVVRAIRIGWLPCVLSSITTAIGLGSLAVSGLAAVREFGIFAALGVIVTSALLLGCIPGALRFRPTAQAGIVGAKPGAHWNSLLSFQSRAKWAICLIGMSMLGGLGVGVTRLSASVRIETLFGPDSKLIRDYAWIENNVGPLVPIDLIVEFHKDCSLTGDERLECLRDAKHCLLENDDVISVTSCLDLMPPSPFPLSGNFTDRYLSLVQEPLEKSGYLRVTDDTHRYRITAHLSALGDQDYGLILKDIQTRLQSVQPARDGVTFQLSGLMPLVHEIQRQLLSDLFASFLTAFALITLVMTIVQAGLLAGFIAMVPNVFPSLVLFGILGWIGYPIDIGSIMTASVAMGIAVDDTLHFLNYFDHRRARGDTCEAALLSTYRHCGKAIIQTTLICGSGLAIFAFSNFVPTARFAWMMVTLLSAALIGDLILLPALLLVLSSKSKHPESHCCERPDSQLDDHSLFRARPQSISGEQIRRFDHGTDGAPLHRRHRPKRQRTPE